MRYLVKNNFKGPMGSVSKGEMIDLDVKLGVTLVASGLVELVSGVQVDEPVESAQPVPQEKMFSKKKKGK